MPVDHSHTGGQYVDGLRGPFIVHDPVDPYQGKYDEEVILTVSDWYVKSALCRCRQCGAPDTGAGRLMRACICRYHTQQVYLARTMLASSNTNSRPPLPDSSIVNEGQPRNIDFVKGKTYRIRVISFSALASHMIHFDSHTMQVIMTDASYIQQSQASQIRIAPAQRYDILLSCTDLDYRNYPYLVSMDVNRDYTNNSVTNSWSANVTGYLMMNTSEPATAVDVVQKWTPVDDLTFPPYDQQAVFASPTQNIVLNFEFCWFDNTPRACFNGQPNIPQKVPALYSAATTNDSNSNPAIYGNVNPFVVNYGDVVQIVVNNRDGAIHPFHLHGHQFQVLDRPKSDTGDWQGHNNTFAATPVRKDTVTVNANSYAVLRYQANNPGVFLFHCHVEWHVDMGLTATIIEAPDHLRGMTFPDDHIQNCKLQDIPYQGNAGGNTQDFTDTSNFNTAYPSVYAGAMYTD